MYSFDWSPYGIHTTLASALAALALPLYQALILSGFELALRAAPALLALYLCSDAFACFAAAQVGYLMHHSFCPWYMIAELAPTGPYLAELSAALAAASCDPWSASLDLIGLIFVPVRSLFYATVVNVVFFAYCHKLLLLAYKGLSRAAAYLVRSILGIFGR